MKKETWLILFWLIVIAACVVLMVAYVRAVWATDLPWWLKLKIIGG